MVRKGWSIHYSPESSGKHLSGMRRTVRVFDMFCGVGGSSRGAQMAGAEPVAALDRWELAANTYQMNFPEATVYRTEARALTPQRVVTDVGQVYQFTPRRARTTIEHVEHAITRLGHDVPFILVYYGTDGAGGFQELIALRTAAILST